MSFKSLVASARHRNRSSSARSLVSRIPCRHRAGLKVALAAAAAVACAPLTVFAAQAVFDGNSAVGNAGDNSTWGDLNNWTTGGLNDTLPVGPLTAPNGCPRWNSTGHRFWRTPPS